MLDAVYAFQSAYGLPVDGIVGRETWNALQDAYQSTVSQLPEDYQDFAEEVYPGRFLVEGDRGEEVRLMQERLRDIARAGGSIPLIAADGVFGPATREAVQALQRAGVISGMPDGSFRPHERMTREQACVVLCAL
mgnify:FL=1